MPSLLLPLGVPLDTEVQYRALIEQSPLGTVVYDASGRPLVANAAFERLTGRALDDLPPGHTVFDDPRLARMGALPLVARAFAGEAVELPPMRHEVADPGRPDGTREVRWTQGHLHPVHGPDGGVRQVVLVHHDVTAHLAAESALRASERRYRALVETVADVVWTGDAHARMTDVAAWCRLTGQSEREARGDGWLDAVHPDDRAPAREALAAAVAAGARYEHEYRLRLADGAHRRVRACAVPVHGDDGTVAEWVGTLVDVEAIRRTEDDLHGARREAEAYAEDAARMADAERAARQEAEEANRAKSEFLGMMSHELRTPLNAITGYVDILELELHGPVNALQRDDLQRVRRGAQVLLALVNDVLNFARLEAGQVELQVADTPLGPLLRELEELVLPQLAARGISHAFHADGDAPAVRADPERVKQILMNLLTNAAKFTEAGGRVTVTCERAGGEVHVRVTDTGRGIPPGNLERIFEPFVQVDRHLTRDSQQGIGLGLAISRDLARRMGGDLRAESEVGKGATFVLTLPGS
ncbi:MAG TPA: ATP-binding protein [Gemmatimonadaceae bacterium]|nr:ATP-binding protein [Gemmatimonadaceae bacterium]